MIYEDLVTQLSTNTFTSKYMLKVNLQKWKYRSGWIVGGTGETRHFYTFKIAVNFARKVTWTSLTISKGKSVKYQCVHCNALS